jgi:hypothetical protein
VPRVRDDKPVEKITILPPPDVAVYPNSLNQHLRAMRGEKKRLDGSYPGKVLAGLPYYSPHLTRTVITNTLDRISSVPKSGISAMLAHAGDKEDDSLSRTTREFYLINQRMAEESDAMAAWRDGEPVFDIDPYRAGLQNFGRRLRGGVRRVAISCLQVD